MTGYLINLRFVNLTPKNCNSCSYDDDDDDDDGDDGGTLHGTLVFIQLIQPYLIYESGRILSVIPE